MEGTNYWDVLTALAWPLAIAGLFVYYRSNLTQLIDAFTAKFEHAADIKIGNIELKGARLDPSSGAPDVSIDGNDYSKITATPADRAARDDQYNRTRSLMLVHRIRPSEKKGQAFDISIFLVRKTSKDNKTARFNDVDYVEYYLGRWFGDKPNGSRYVVRTSENGFAMTTSAFGSPLCIAKIHFHDGEVVETYRYLDFEMQEDFGRSYSSS